MLVTRRPRLPQGQLWYIEPMQTYGLLADRQGVCYGVANKAIDAILLNDVKTFNDRFFLLHELLSSKKGFFLALDEARQESIRAFEKAKVWDNEYALKKKKSLHAYTHVRINELWSQSLTSKQKLTLSIPAFFEGIDIYHQGSNYPHVFEKNSVPFAQEAILSSALSKPKKLDKAKRGGRIEIGSFSGIYSQYDILAYLTSLRNTLQADPSLVKPVTLLLGNANHAITIGYDPLLKQWIVVDPNYLPARFIYDDKKVAYKILKAFSGLDSNHYVAFTTQVFVSGDNELQAKPLINNWRKTSVMTDMHRVTAQKTELVDNAKGSWLLCAVIQGDLETVKTILSFKKDDKLSPLIDVNRMNKHGRTALHLAIQYGHADIVTYLLDHGADINKKENDDIIGSTPHEMAILTGRLDILKLLLDRGVATETTDLYLAAKYGHLSILLELLSRGVSLAEGGAFALVGATENGHLDIVKELLNRGVDPNSYPMRPPLLMAVKKGHDDIVTELLNHGADFHIKGDDESSLLHMAVKAQHTAVVMKLLHHAAMNPNETDKLGNTPLHLAAMTGNLDILDLFIKNKNVNPTPLNKKNNTPLHVAASEGKWESINFLMLHGFLPDAKTLMLAAKGGHLLLVKELLQRGVKADHQALFYAATYNHLEVVKELLNHGISINKGIAKYDNMTALHNPVAHGYLDIVTLLLDNGANIDQATTDGQTPLNFALDYEQLNVVLTLLSRGAKLNAKEADQGSRLQAFLLKSSINPSLPNHEGTTLLHQVAKHGNTEVFDLLMFLPGADLFTTDSESQTPMHLAAMFGKIDLLKYLDHASHTLKNVGNKDDSRPLHIAARAGNNEMVTFLVQAGANPNLKDRFGYTPLHIALEIKDTNMVQDLMTLHPDVNIPTNDNETPLHIAIKENNKLSVINLLITQGANPALNNKFGKTPIQLALDQGRMDLVILMLRAMKALDADMLKILESYRINIAASLMSQLEEIEKGQAIEQIDTLLEQENALLYLLQSPSTTLHYDWHRLFTLKVNETDEMKALKALRAHLAESDSTISRQRQFF
jgi:ankyrin repeat protein